MSSNLSTALPGLDQAIATLRRNGYTVRRDYQRGGYIVTDSNGTGRRDGIGAFALINLANDLEPAKTDSATT